MKTCTNSKCSQVNPQPLNCFYKKKSGRDGLAGRCIKCTNAQTDAWAKRNKEKVRATKNKWERNNVEKKRESSKRWSKENPGKKNAQTRKRQAAKLQRTPKWLNKDQLKEIEQLYLEAIRLTKETGIPHEVDHIEPLQGKEISGLHVPWNLRVVRRSANRSKSNKRDKFPPPILS